MDSDSPYQTYGDPALPEDGKSLGSVMLNAEKSNRLRPRQLPEIRQWISKACDLIHNSGSVGERLIAWERRTIQDPDLRLVFVSKDMTELLCQVAHTVPDDVTLEDIVRPYVGLALFEHPVIGSDSSNQDRPIEVHGQMWGPIRIQANGKSHTGISIGTVGHVEAIEKEGDALGSGYLPLGRTEWVDDESITEVQRDENDAFAHDVGDLDSYQVSAIEDRRLFVALMTLMQQERHVETNTWKPMSKSAKKRLGSNTEVTVVQLRRAEPEHHDTAEGTSGKWKVRTWVAPYFRMQPFGPGRSQRRLQLIEGHVKGPEGAPMSTKQRVWSLKR